MIQNTIALFGRTYWQPFTDPRRAAVLIGSFFGLFGFGTMSFISSYDFAGVGPAALETFMCLRLGGIAVLAVFFYLAFSLLDSLAFRLVLLALLGLAFAAYLLLADTPLLRGIVAGLLSAIYWGSLHIAMTHNSTEANRGYEVAVMNIMWLLGGVAASAAGAWFLEQQMIDTGVTIAFTTLLASTICMLLTARRQPRLSFIRYVGEARLVWRENHFFIKRTAVFALFEAAQHLATAYMSLLAYTPRTAATLLISRVVVEFALAPLIGKLASQMTQHNFRYGLAFICASWIGLSLLARHEIAFIAFSLIGGFGLRVMSAGINVKMYALKSYTAMMWTELALGLGRITIFLVMIPLLFYSTALYAIAFAVLAVIVFIIRTITMRQGQQGQLQHDNV